jgi:hypothetical protein
VEAVLIREKAVLCLRLPEAVPERNMIFSPEHERTLTLWRRAMWV